MKRVCLLALSLSFFLPARSQESTRVEDKVFNWGAKVGLNSSFPIINSIQIEGVKAENVHLQYKVGVLAAAFCRFNFNRFFIQPSFQWRSTSGDIRFNLPQEVASASAPRDYDRLKYKVRSLEVPMLLGYKIINEGPYGLSLMGGANFKYNYDVSYSSDFRDSPRRYTSDSTPWGVNIMAGVGVTLWRFFFDVTYELGLNQVDSDFEDYSSHQPSENNITIDKRINVMTFSLGFLF